MTIPTFKFTEFIDLLVTKLYDAERQGEKAYVDLDAIARQIHGEVPPDWVFEAAKVLETRQLAHCTINSRGIFAKITGEGMLYVEEGRGITRKIQEAPSHYYVTINGNGNVVAGHGATVTATSSSTGESRIESLLREIGEQLKADTSLKAADKEEALEYTNLVRRESAKAEPNRSLLAAVLDPLSKIASIAGNVTTLMKYLNS
jgi:hypothetical protein